MDNKVMEFDFEYKLRTKQTMRKVSNRLFTRLLQIMQQDVLEKNTRWDVIVVISTASVGWLNCPCALIQL